MNFIPAIEYTDAPIRIEFDYVPEGDPLETTIKTSQTTTTSSSGITQTQFNYNEQVYKVTYTFVTEAIKSAYETFFKDHGSKGLPFKYFTSKDEIEFLTVTLSKFDFKPVKLYSINTPGNFEYSFKMEFRESL